MQILHFPHSFFQSSAVLTGICSYVLLQFLHYIFCVFLRLLLYIFLGVRGRYCRDVLSWAILIFSFIFTTVQVFVNSNCVFQIDS